ncbi:MAG: branched chain amino acid aminotransferase [Betaproteobacteria bacterium TMED156]|nr:MAG: branched chain amino acid aminotransferase [Betaproteobacteria bacterium TMED156]
MPMSNRDGFIWMDGEFVAWREANIHILTHTLHYGMGVFEGVRCYETTNGSAIFRIGEHTQRLINSAKIFQIKIPFSRNDLETAQIEVVRMNKLKACYIRPIVFLGSEKMGLNPEGCSVHVSIAAWPWGTYLGDDGLSNGIRVKTSSFSRHHINSSMVRAKACGYYINSILAHQEVSKNGYDEALMLDTDGYVSEGAGENLFIVKKNIIYTTDLTTCLDGITRDTVFELAKEMGITIKEKRITRDEIYGADEAFFTGTAAEITPIKELDDRQIGDGKKGEITNNLQQLFFDIVAGKTEKFSHWLNEI